SITALLYLVALMRMRLFAIAPIARNTIMDNLNDPVIVLDMRGNIVDFNQAAQNTCKSITQYFGVSPLNLPNEWAEIFRTHQHSLHLNEEVQIGDKIYILTISPIINQRKHTIGRLFILHDVTEQKQNEAKMRQLSRAVEQSPESIIITDLKGNIEYVNPRFEQVTGYPLHEVVGKNPRLLKTGHTHPEVYSDLWSALRAGREWQGEFINRKKNGDIYYEWTTIAPIVDSKGNITHYIASNQDVTSQKMVEEALIRREREMATLYEMSLEMNSVTDLPTLLLATVRRACELLKTWGGLLYMYNPEENILKIAIGYQVPDEWIGLQIQPGDGLAGRVFQEKTPLVVEDYSHWENRIEALTSPLARRSLGVPLKVRDQV
ncbi:MAG TPA: PAS domain S-box protein, partial [Pseudomonadales bacterium]|nr:PAS domain S-box protein [Pseudomonadales bacterium]